MELSHKISSLVILQILHGGIGIVFLLATLSELTNGSHRRPARFHWIATAIALATCVLNLLSSVEYELHRAALLWTVGVLMAYIGFLRIEARLWTLEADCACFGHASGSIRAAMCRNAVLTVVLAGVTIVQWDRAAVLLTPAAAVGFGIGLISARALGPTRRLVVRNEADLTDSKTPKVVRLLALDSRCVKCIRLAHRITKTRLPRGVDGILTDHAMRIVFQDSVRHYHPAHATALTRLPTPCLVDIRQDGAVLNIESIGTVDESVDHQPSPATA